MTVLLYHGFDVAPRSAVDDPHSLFTTVAALDAHLDLLDRARFRPVDLAGWLAGKRRRRYLVTFDDAYRSVLDLAAPVLRRRGVPGVVFAPPGLAGRDAPPEAILDADGLRELAAYGIDLGVHGFDHVPLAGLEPDELERQTSAARTALADATGVVARAFAYPNGSFDDAARAAVAAAGFEVGFSVDRAEGPYAVPRVGVYGRDGRVTVALKIVLGAPTLRPALALARRLRP
jgi:peptidoglycan/xylan/chitin deacetylase (PgdA/CDA1 family)